MIERNGTKPIGRLATKYGIRYYALRLPLIILSLISIVRLHFGLLGGHSTLRKVEESIILHSDSIDPSESKKFLDSDVASSYQKNITFGEEQTISDNHGEKKNGGDSADKAKDSATPSAIQDESISKTDKHSGAQQEGGYQLATENTNLCPLAFGLGHQKSGTTTIVKALGSISNLTAKNDMWPFWAQENLTDDQVLDTIHPRYGQIQKEGSGIYYAEQMARLCPKMRFYIVKRDMLTTVRSVADRLEITDNTTCDNDLQWMAGGWRPLFTKSNDTSCLVRIAASILHYNNMVEGFTRDFHVNVKEIQYEEYLNDPALAIQKLCLSLEVLGSCNNTQKLDTAQYQGKGKNRGKKFEEIWSKDTLNKLRNMLEITKGE